MHLADITDRAVGDVFVTGAGAVKRVALVAHLRDDFRTGLGFLSKVSGFVNRPAQRLLDVNVFAEIHRSGGDRRVHVIRRGDDDPVDIFLLVEHLPVIGVALDLRQLVFDEALEIGGAVLCRPARVRVHLRFR